MFVSVPFTDFNVGTIYEMLKKIETTQKWSIGGRTPNKRRLSEGDKILFYQGGEEDGGRIVASAELASSLQQPENADSFVKLRNFEVWKKPVDMRSLIDKLSFIKNKRHWGLCIQGGIRKIPEVDYNKIIRKSSKMANIGQPCETLL
jgi:hypothetical protein